MGICVAIDSGGYVVEVAEAYPACSEFALLPASQISMLTFWADLSVALEPPDAWPLYSAVLLLFAIAFGAKQIARLILNR